MVEQTNVKEVTKTASESATDVAKKAATAIMDEVQNSTPVPSSNKDDVKNSSSPNKRAEQESSNGSNSLPERWQPRSRRETEGCFPNPKSENEKADRFKNNELPDIKQLPNDSIRIKDIFSEMRKEKMEKDANYIAGVLTSKGDFGNGYKRDQIQKMFKDAASDGPQAVKDLQAAINKRLEQVGSPLRIDAKYSQDVEGGKLSGLTLVQSVDVTLTKKGSDEPEDKLQAEDRTKLNRLHERSIEDLLQDLPRIKGGGGGGGGKGGSSEQEQKHNPIPNSERNSLESLPPAHREQLEKGGASSAEILKNLLKKGSTLESHPMQKSTLTEEELKKLFEKKDK